MNTRQKITTNRKRILCVSQIATAVSLLMLALAPLSVHAQRPSIADLQQGILDGEAAHEGLSNSASRNLEAVCGLYTAQGYTLPPACIITVFVTSATYTGNLGGLDGAHAKCQAAADAAGLLGTFRAWMSDSTTSPSTDPSFTRGSFPYVRVDGATIADNWVDLTDGTLQQPLDRDENGAIQWITVWTGTRPSGDPWSTGGNKYCDDWTSAGPPGGMIGREGLVGDNTMTDFRWTDDAPPAECPTTRALYCFEQ